MRVGSMVESAVEQNEAENSKGAELESPPHPQLVNGEQLRTHSNRQRVVPLD